MKRAAGTANSMPLKSVMEKLLIFHYTMMTECYQIDLPDTAFFSS